MDSSLCPLSKHSCPLGESTNHQFIRSIRSDWETTVLNGRDLCHLGLICLLDVRAKISQVKVHGLHNIILWMLKASICETLKKVQFSVEIKLLLVQEDQMIWNSESAVLLIQVSTSTSTDDFGRWIWLVSAAQQLRIMHIRYFISSFSIGGEMQKLEDFEVKILSHTNLEMITQALPLVCTNELWVMDRTRNLSTRSNLIVTVHVLCPLPTWY